MVGNITLFVLLLTLALYLIGKPMRYGKRKQRDAEQLALALNDTAPRHGAARAVHRPSCCSTRMGRSKQAVIGSSSSTSAIAPDATTIPSRSSAACVVVGGISSR
jgi:hypothetical protein